MTASKHQKKRSNKRRTVQVNIWVDPSVKAELRKRAYAQGLSVSKIGGVGLEYFLNLDIQTQHGSVLQPMVKKAIRQQLRPLVWLLIRTAYDTEVNNQLISNFLRLNPSTKESYTTILDNAHKAAKHNILRKVPDLSNIIAEIDKWMEKAAEKPDTGGKH